MEYPSILPEYADVPSQLKALIAVNELKWNGT